MHKMSFKCRSYYTSFQDIHFCYAMLQQIKALLQSVGTSFCPNYVDWFGSEGSDSHSRNADRSVLAKFLQAHPADFSTTKLQVLFYIFHSHKS